MGFLPKAVVQVRDFLDLGGNVLLPIMGATFVMWFLILDRYVYFVFRFPADRRRTVAFWGERRDQVSWRAHRVRELLISELNGKLRRSIVTVKTLVSACLLMGLLGTVVGMIEVFEIMSILGGGNPRALASGVYKAMIPTMTGMVAALSGYFFSARMDRFARRETERLSDDLVHA